jgi:hypothetical protein
MGMDMIASIIAAADSGGIFDTLKHWVNVASQPAPFITISFIVFALMFILYKWWTKPIRGQARQRAHHHDGDQRDAVRVDRLPPGGIE